MFLDRHADVEGGLATGLRSFGLGVQVNIRVDNANVPKGWFRGTTMLERAGD
jgi:hypothetical protein